MVKISTVFQGPILNRGYSLQITFKVQKWLKWSCCSICNYSAWRHLQRIQVANTYYEYLVLFVLNIGCFLKWFILLEGGLDGQKVRSVKSQLLQNSRKSQWNCTHKKGRGRFLIALVSINLTFHFKYFIFEVTKEQVLLPLTKKKKVQKEKRWTS